jgi:intein-encoded DNA endonuclease-like protein
LPSISQALRHDRIPPELAKILYSESIDLAKTRLGGIRIARKLSKRYSLKICPGTINHWIYGDRHPRLRNIFDVRPSPALSYIIGANKGDGCTLMRSGCVKLEVTDRDFAETFDAKMAELFSRKKQNKILVRRFGDERLPLFVVKYSSRQLSKLLRMTFNRLLKLAFVFPRDFLRGFFDAEGHVDVSVTMNLRLAVGAENSSKPLLQAIRRLLREEISISSRIDRKRRAGTLKVIRGKSFIMRRTSFSLMIGRIEDVNQFAEKVGFSIRRKNKKLWDALGIIANTLRSNRAQVWERLYSKKRGERINRESF